MRIAVLGTGSVGRTQGFPPTMTVKDTDSLAEVIQRSFPEARVVKSMNTVNAAVMVDPSRVGGCRCGSG